MPDAPSQGDDFAPYVVARAVCAIFDLLWFIHER